jgi:hypothetical protein
VNSSLSSLPPCPSIAFEKLYCQFQKEESQLQAGVESPDKAKASPQMGWVFRRI